MTQPTKKKPARKKPAKRKKSTKPRAPRTPRYAWCETEILEKVICPKIEAAQAMGASSKEDVLRYLRTNYDCTVSMNVLDEWFKALGFTSQRITLLSRNGAPTSFQPPLEPDHPTPDPEELDLSLPPGVEEIAPGLPASSSKPPLQAVGPAGGPSGPRRPGIVEGVGGLAI